MADFRAADVSRIEIRLGETRTLESPRQAVVPPFVMILPFIELPSFVNLVRQDNLNEEGVHGCTFTLRGIAAGDGRLRVGFRDLRSGQVVIEKTIGITVLS
jgi:hypothetical protein